MDKKQLKILLVEAQSNVAKEIKKILEGKGHKIAISRNTEAGLLRVEAYKFDLFVINCGNDGKQGLDFARSVLKREEYQNEPFLFIYNAMTKTDFRFLKFNHHFDIMKLPLDSTELEIRFKRLIEAKDSAHAVQPHKKEMISIKTKSEKDEQAEKEDRGKVLLVEDNPLNQKVLGMFISKLGFEFDVASNGQMAVDFTLKDKYRYVLMDIYMPGMDGTEATTIIRKNEESGDHRAKIIAITANESEESVKRCYDSGMDDYLVKPFTLEVLKEKLA